MGNWIIADPSSRLPALSRLFCTPYEIAMQVPVKLRISSCNYPPRTLDINSAGSNWQTQSYLAYYSPLAAAWNWVAHRLSLFYLTRTPEIGHGRSGLWFRLLVSKCKAWQRVE